MINHYAESVNKQIIPKEEVCHFGSGTDTLLKVAELVDDWVHYFHDCFDQDKISTFACGLFSVWDPTTPDIFLLPVLTLEGGHIKKQAAGLQSNTAYYSKPAPQE